MSSAVASAILEGMPDASDLRVLRSDGVTWVSAGKAVLFRFADDDCGMRNVAVAALRQLGFSGQQVAAALGLTENYVATLHQRALREGTAGLVRPRGRPRTLEPSQWEQARAWRAAGVRDAEIARRLGVQQSTVLRRLGPAQVQGERWRKPLLRARLRRASRRSRRSRNRRPPERRGEAPRPEPGVVPPAYGGRAAAEGEAGVLPVCRGDAAARLSRAGRGHLPRRGTRGRLRCCRR